MINQILKPYLSVSVLQLVRIYQEDYTPNKTCDALLQEGHQMFYWERLA
jgi:hypothetical protein